MPSLVDDAGSPDAIAYALMEAAMTSLMVQNASARSLSAVAAAITRACTSSRSPPEVEDRLDALRPCLAAQHVASLAGQDARTSSGLVRSDVHVLAGAAKHQWGQPIATLSPAAARRAQRGRRAPRSNNLSPHIETSTTNK